MQIIMVGRYWINKLTTPYMLQQLLDFPDAPMFISFEKRPQRGYSLYVKPLLRNDFLIIFTLTLIIRMNQF